MRIAILGFMMGRAVILGSLSPFGLSYFAAVETLWPSWSSLVGAAVAAGAATVGFSLASAKGGQPYTWAWEYPASMFLAYLMLRTTRGRSAGDRVVKAGAAVFISRVILRVLTVLFVQANLYGMLMVFFEGLLSAALTVLFTTGLRAVASGAHAQRGLNTEELTGLAVILASSLAGIGDVRAGPVLLRNSVSSALTAAAAYLGGSPAGAVAGAASGLIVSLSGGAQLGYIGVQTLSGILGGLFRDLGKWGSISGYLLGALAMSLLSEDSSSLLRVMAEASLGACVVLLLPSSAVAAVEKIVKPRTPPSMERDVESLEVVTSRLRSYSMALREVSKAFEQALTSSMEDEDDRTPRLFGTIAARACEGCPEYRRCWEDEFRVTYRGLHALLKLFQEGGKSASIVAGAEGQGLKCRFPERLALTVGHIVEIEDLNRRWRRRVYDGTEVLSSQLRAAAMLMDRVAGDLLTPEKTPVFSMPRKIGYDIGVAGKNKKGSVVSGDTVLAREIRNNRLLIALSDGMGAGAPAAGESRTTVELVEMLMDAGFDRDTTVKTVNSVMMTRSNGEAFATLDMGLVDLVTGDAEFVKIGACPSFIKRGNEVSVIKAQSLPVGILANIPIEAIPRTLVPGDVLVMVTDGVLQARKDPSPKESWVASFISRTRWGSPQDLAERILERSLGGASRGAGGTQQKEASDDMTVLCVAFHPIQ